MICVGDRYAPENLYATSAHHIAVTNCFYPNDDWYANRDYSAGNMKKVSEVYVGNEKVYPDPFPYFLRYRMRLNFDFWGNSYGFGRPSSSYTESTCTGYIEDTVLFETAFPMLIQTQPLPSPGDLYNPSASSGERSNPPWGKAEYCSEFSGTEYLLTPAAALIGPPPGTDYNGYWSLGGSIYQQYTDKNIYPGVPYEDAGYRYTLKREVYTHKINTASRNWDDEPSEFEAAYTITARRSVMPYQASEYLLRGWYYDTGSRHSEIRVSSSQKSNSYVTLGFVYRPPTYPGISGLYLITDMCHYGSSNYVLLGASSPRMYGYRYPGYMSPFYRESYSIKAPMFTGHKHFDCYDSSWDVGRRVITDWEQADTRSHTNLDGQFELLQNNNPAFSSASDYVKAFAS